MGNILKSQKEMDLQALMRMQGMGGGQMPQPGVDMD